MGMKWKDFRPSDGILRAEGHSHIITSTMRLKRADANLRRAVAGSLFVEQEEIYIPSARADRLGCGVIRTEPLFGLPGFAVSTQREIVTALSFLDGSGVSSAVLSRLLKETPEFHFRVADLVAFGTPSIRRRGSSLVQVPAPSDNVHGVITSPLARRAFCLFLKQYISSQPENFGQEARHVLEICQDFSTKYTDWDSGEEATGRSIKWVVRRDNVYLDSVQDIMDNLTSRLYNEGSSFRYADLLALHIRLAMLCEGGETSILRNCGTDYAADIQVYFDQLPKIVDEMEKKGVNRLHCVDMWCCMMLRAASATENLLFTFFQVTTMQKPQTAFWTTLVIQTIVLALPTTPRTPSVAQFALQKRAFDATNTTLVFYHGQALQSEKTTVEDLLFGLYAWLDDHPSETLITSFQYEGSTKKYAANDADVQMEMFRTLTSPVTRKYYVQKKGELGTLGEARGKITLFRRFNLDKLPKSYEDALPGLHFPPSLWSDNGLDIELAYNDERNLTAYIEDFYEPGGPIGSSAAYNIDLKFNATVSHLEKATTHYPESLFWTWASSECDANIPPDYPRIMALGNGTELTPLGGVNQRLLPVLKRLQGKRLAIVMLDFFGTPGNLVETILGLDED
ncbi:hypothetical protein HYALB_00002935 [Hymenoscyphus albidus]|uniref:Uncharacterized protein n=1 Tax=Hymenoscyphus albidus TaxID=595503 RepID=A0A9N9M051_9HELO|nr:hypothetical protein HYALB_00002935 [Hymenoscyphus albidus]